MKISNGRGFVSDFWGTEPSRQGGGLLTSLSHPGADEEHRGNPSRMSSVVNISTLEKNLFRLGAPTIFSTGILPDG
jgi:hypothetical protein